MARVVANLFKRSLLCSAATLARASLRPIANIEQLYEKSQKNDFDTVCYIYVKRLVIVPKFFKKLNVIKFYSDRKNKFGLSIALFEMELRTIYIKVKENIGYFFRKSVQTSRLPLLRNERYDSTNYSMASARS
ncbi:hypothetical protein CGI32_08580 [Vibrio parahaemolyticus]|nr:hypothetical protein BTZ05_06545 [Vibrio parahaemolyticus]TOE41525.1 hypothetical protein CGJ45_12205 [Vibrio parahaemolyticus]TOJ88657.1 hypothetical protein CGI32_08580 [Vibrio parahaemolyticus]